MSYKIKITDSFSKKVKKFLKLHKDIFNRYEKAMRILQENPFHPSLRLHKLKSSLNEYCSISINIEYRVIIDFIIKDNVIIPLDIGTHDDVY